MAERMMRDVAIEEALKIKIRATLEHNNQSFVQCCDRSDEERNKNKVKLTVTYDMGWQKRSSGRRYDYTSRHAFIICGISKVIIGVVP